jgi:hypothetical protein
VLIGHYGVAFAAKKFAPQTSLGTLMAAAILLDLIWPVFLLIGIEKVTIAPGETAANPVQFTYYPFSHSLLMSIVWGALFGLIYFGVRRYSVGAMTVGILVVSHWLLDAIVHVPDLPLTPWDMTRIGLGAWRSVPLSIVLEAAVFGLGVWSYFSFTQGRDRTGIWSAVLLVLLSLVVYGGALFGPPPPDVPSVAWGGMAQWLVVILAWWTDRHRSVDSLQFAE